MFKIILTHRGIDNSLEKDSKTPIMESSYQAFLKQLEAGFGLEFDIQELKDGNFAVSHDKSLQRISNGNIDLKFSEIELERLHQIELANNSRLCDLEEILDLIILKGRVISALHLKHSSQNMNSLNKLIDILSPRLNELVKKLIIFDASIETAKFFKMRIPQIELAASVSDNFDISRFGPLCGNTLLSIDELVAHKNIYSWAWLDEWDLVGPNDPTKSFINEDTIKILRDHNFKIVAVSPELHGTSSALLGGEVHEDGCDIERLKSRWCKWEDFLLDAICTDHASWLKDHKRKMRHNDFIY